jgi:hypothetical protein
MRSVFLTPEIDGVSGKGHLRPIESLECFFVAVVDELEELWGLFE